MQTVLAGDLGGTKCRFALVSEDYGVHCVERIDTVRDQPAFLEVAQAAAENARAHAREVLAKIAEAPGPEHGVFESNVNVLTTNGPPYDPAMGTYQLRALLCRVERDES